MVSWESKFSVDVNSFSQQVAGMVTRLSHLLDHASNAPDSSSDLSSDAFKELGIATEELQVAIEELQQQNEELSNALELVGLERRRYEDLFQSAPHAYLITSLEGTIQEANHMASQLLRVPKPFLIGKPLFPFVREVDRQLYWEELRRRQQRDYFQEWTIGLQARNQEIIHVACSTVTVRDLDEKPIGFRWTLRDITEQKRLEALEHTEHDLNSDSDLAFLQNRSTQTYSQGELIPLEPESLWYVTGGLVKLTSLTTGNKEMMTGLISSGTPFGAYLTALPIYQATALTEVKVVSVSLNEIAASAYLARLMFTRISQRLRQTEALLTIQGEQCVEDSLYQFLQLLKIEVGESVVQGIRLNIRLTHEDLASACGSTRATITRALGKLERQGVITFDSKRHIVLTNQ
jgi:PAS domain S-box-containing protein